MISFNKAKVSNTEFYNVFVEEEYLKVLENFSWHDWTTAEAQRIINGVTATQIGVSSNFRFQVGEDVSVKSIDDGVYFFDLLANRATGNKTLTPSLVMNHTEFLDFMEKLKSFLESEGV